MFNFIRNLFKPKEESSVAETPQAKSFVFITDYPELVDVLQREAHTFSNKIYYEDVQYSRQFATALYETLYVDQVQTTDPDLTLEYTRWINESKATLIDRDFTCKFILEMANDLLCNSSPEEHYLCDAIRFAMLSEDDIEKLKNRSLGDALTNVFGSLRTNKQIQQFMVTSNKKNSSVYVAYSNMTFEVFSEEVKQR